MKFLTTIFFFLTLLSEIQSQELSFYTPDFKSCVVYENIGRIQSVSSDWTVNFKLSNFYSNKSSYKLANGDSLLVSIYRDSTFLLQFIDKTGTIYRSGELKSNLSRIVLIDSIFHNHGDVEYYRDTMYQLKKHGKWYERQESTYKMSTYENGLKHGTSQLKLSSSCIDDSINLEYSEYSNGEKISDLINWNDSTFIKEKILGKWYHPYCLEHRIKDGIWIFTKEKPQRKTPNAMQSSEFKAKNKYIGEMFYLCATGRSSDDFTKKYSWKLSGNTIKIEETEYQILYLSEEMMILKRIIKNHNNK